jgi:hypothetical protein
MPVLTAKTSKASRGKVLTGGRKHARTKTGPATRTAEAKAFNKVLDEVIRDYSSTLRNLAS